MTLPLSWININVRCLAERLQQSGSQVFVTAITQGQLKEMQVGKGKLFQVDTGKITDTAAIKNNPILFKDRITFKTILFLTAL